MLDLDHVFWNALSGAQGWCAEGAGPARRYGRGFSPILAFEDRFHPDFGAIAPFCDVGERFYTDAWSGPVPEGWELHLESTMFKMVWRGPMPEGDAAPEALLLGPEHVAQAMELAALTKPGPFGPRTIELGEYFGLFEGERLIAMAGERFFDGSWREISGVCTHPDFQGRGLAKGLMLKLIRREMERGETPFLHVTHANTGAHALYYKMGFTDHLETVVRVVSRKANEQG